MSNSEARFAVLQNGEPAIILDSEPWANNVFPTFEEAVRYAEGWLGHWAPGPENWKLNAEYWFGGFDEIEGDTEWMVIQELR